MVGEVGSGKTMLCRMLEERLPPTVDIVYLANPNLSARDIIYAIAFELKLPVDAHTDRLVVMQKLQDYLLGEQFTVADAYLFTVTNWARIVKVDLSTFANLLAYRTRVSERPGVQAAMRAEGLLK